MSEENITEGMKMFDIKPDYYVDDNYREWAYDEDSSDELSEDDYCYCCDNSTDECECTKYCSDGFHWSIDDEQEERTRKRWQGAPVAT